MGMPMQCKFRTSTVDYLSKFTIPKHPVLCQWFSTKGRSRRSKMRYNHS